MSPRSRKAKVVEADLEASMVTVTAPPTPSAVENVSEKTAAARPMTEPFVLAPAKSSKSGWTSFFDEAVALCPISTRSVSARVVDVMVAIKTNALPAFLKTAMNIIR